MELWDALIEAGIPYAARPAGLLALDVARIEAGLILVDADFVGAKSALNDTQLYTPFELGLGRLVHVDKAPFVGQKALRAEKLRGPRRVLVGVEVDWNDLEALYDAAGHPRSPPRRRACRSPSTEMSGRSARPPARRGRQR